MDFRLTEEQQKIIETCRQLAGDFLTRAAEHDRDRTAPVENYEKLREAGLFGIAVPKQYGGLGIGFLGYTLAITELAQGCAATANSFNMHANATGSIAHHPDIPENVKRMVVDLAINQGKLMCTSVSEPSSSSLLATSYTPSLEARRVKGGYELYGKKAFCSMVESSDYVYLYAHPEGDPNPQASIGFLVPIDKGRVKGVTIHDVWDTMGMRATRSNTVDYNGVFVPDELYLHRTDEFLNDFIIRGANWSFGGFAAVYLGVGLGILSYATELLTARKAKGYAQPQGFHPDNRHRIGIMASELHAAKLAMLYAAWYSDTYGPSIATFHHFMRAKYMIAESTSNAAHSASVACGAHGMTKELHLERMIRDAATAPIMPPNIDACADQVGLLSMGLNPMEAMPPLQSVEPPVESAQKEGVS
ncbi:acyl-CoA dehydrogenase family protein [Paenibacillus beijingensis]|uniref:Acyl-CoA dehydrogenase n=1 Tax=Paenibacillus beijingensis TaxID=1126833 RepID=A0A0D5NGT1_9BACL|nr:acyl-CoA dehydrogenase family protein [Paenibacillus beijingensis]AJY74152.1 acyl-CoA dehydrogenase [Paenibacillus beijingensis]